MPAIKPGQHISTLVISEVLNSGGFATVVKASQRDGRGPEIALKISSRTKTGTRSFH